ncbi:unnamed protein product [Clonostachys rosea]|uniref:Major facilitator superfamily (MFS) profile domain-containing protein n=1 Tax=Bionectria ochroleuca TaxID=29856 RepID=A0ABY6UFY0_BIOOC|nr:unnamed protein product [Clonostachys rosea]
MPIPSTAASSTTMVDERTLLSDQQRCDILLNEIPLRPANREPPYHIFSRRQKWNLVFLVSLAGSFSPLSSNIYFPAVDSIASELHISASLVALTITVYMVVQGIAPSLFGAISDTGGRRLAFALTLAVYTASNLALALTANFPMLMVLRGLQAAGSAATISISAGVIADIADPSERGGFMGTNAGIRMTGQAIGPIIGGALNSAWGFRSIFWLLFSMSILVLVALLVFLPETQRSVAGNGSIPLTGFKKPLAYMIRPPTEWTHAARKHDHDSPPKKPSNLLQKTLAPLGYIFQKDIAALLTWGAVVYTAWSMVTSSTTTTLLRSYPYLTQWQIGLCFLPNGLGCVAGSLGTGRLLDASFRGVETEYKKERGINTVNVKKDRDFPFERARLALVPYFSIAFLISMVLYGPSFELNDLHRFQSSNLAAHLILQFFIAFTSTAIFNVNSTMLIDCFPDRPASATALNNLCRCLLGAAGVSIIQPLIDSLKLMKAFMVLAGIVLCFSPLIWVEWKWGQQWRQEREKRRRDSSA